MKLTIDTKAKTVEVHEGTLGEIVDFLGENYKEYKLITLSQGEKVWLDPEAFKVPTYPWIHPQSPWYSDYFKVTCDTNKDYHA